MQIRDGDMAVLTGFGTLPLVLKPHTTRNPDGHGDTIMPARPTTIGHLAIIELEQQATSIAVPLILTEHRNVWDAIQQRALLDDERRALRVTSPRVVTLRVLDYPRVERELHGLPIFMAIDEHIGRPILAIGNSVLSPASKPGPRTQVRIGVQWHPDGFDPEWLSWVT